MCQQGWGSHGGKCFWSDLIGERGLQRPGFRSVPQPPLPCPYSLSDPSKHPPKRGGLPPSPYHPQDLGPLCFTSAQLAPGSALLRAVSAGLQGWVGWPRSRRLGPALHLLVHPQLLVLLAPEALVVVAFTLEELLEVGLAVEFPVERRVAAQAGEGGQG